MMSNKFIAIGKLSKEIERSVTAGGTTIAKTRIEIKGREDKDGKPMMTSLNLWAVGRLADDICLKASIGDGVAIEGEIRNYTYKVDGQERWGTDVYLTDFLLVSKAPRSRLEPK